MKLTKTQAEVLRKMTDGWTLSGGSFPSLSINKGHSVSTRVLNNLRKGRFIQRHSWIRRVTGYYGLTKLGRRALKEHEEKKS